MACAGGLTARRDMQALCAEHGIRCWVGGMLESAIGGALCAALATLPVAERRDDSGMAALRTAGS